MGGKSSRGGLALLVLEYSSSVVLLCGQVLEYGNSYTCELWASLRSTSAATNLLSEGRQCPASPYRVPNASHKRQLASFLPR